MKFNPNTHRAVILQRMVKIANQSLLNIKTNAAAWESDIDKEIIFIPHNWTTADTNYYTWEQYVLKDLWENYSPDSGLQEVPHFVYSFYHEVGHFQHEGNGDMYYPHEATRLLIGSLPQEFKELATRAYFEIPEEQDATEWAVYQVYIDICNNEKWWEV